MEIGGGATLADPSLSAGSSWHLVVEGQPIIKQGHQSWELLPGHWICLDQPGPYEIVNPAPTRAKLVTLFFAREGADIPQGDERHERQKNCRLRSWLRSLSGSTS